MGYNTMIGISLILLVASLWETARSIRRGINERLLSMRKQVRHDLQLLENERIRIANDLHDELGPLLTVVSVRVNCLQPHSEREEDNLEKIKSFVAETVDRIGEIVRDLNPVVLTTDGLQGAFETFMSRQRDTTNIQLDYVCKIKRQLPSVTSLQVYRIIQELVNNGIRHSKASHINVCLFETADKLSLLYGDNGIGFDEVRSRTVKGLGLKSLRTRTDILGGTIKLTTKPGHGVEYNFEIPL